MKNWDLRSNIKEYYENLKKSNKNTYEFIKKNKKMTMYYCYNIVKK